MAALKDRFNAIVDLLMPIGQATDFFGVCEDVNAPPGAIESDEIRLDENDRATVRVEGEDTAIVTFRVSTLRAVNIAAFVAALVGDCEEDASKMLDAFDEWFGEECDARGIDPDELPGMSTEEPAEATPG